MRFFCLCLLVWGICLPAVSLTVSEEIKNAISARKWEKALNDVTAKEAPLASYLQWRALLDPDRTPDFDSLARFIDRHPEWPQISRLRILAEKALFHEMNRGAFAKEWLTRYPPLSGYGKLAKVRALGVNHQTIREAWIEGDFERQDEIQIASEFKASLDSATHITRAEHLLLDRNTGAAERMRERVPADFRKLLDARTDLQRRKSNVNHKIDLIPARLRNDHGLLADRAIWRHEKGLISGARELLLEMDKNSPYAPYLWRIRASYARDAIEAKNYGEAHKLLLNAGNTLPAAANADALWMLGWLDLTFRNNPPAAYETFFKLFHAVNYPISKARGAYWAARAARANGNSRIAEEWLQRAAEYPTAFYGQLAQQALNKNQPLRLPDMPAADAAAKKRFVAHPLTSAALALHQSGLHREAASLIEHLAEGLSHPKDFAALAELMADHSMTFAQVRVSKEAQKHNIFLPLGWPTPASLPNLSVPTALALAISRQESEFNPDALSHANARGLMQLLPSTGKLTAAKLNLSFRLEMLFDPKINMRLGSKYLGDLISGFGDNYILAIAGYNAGPGRSRQWVERFGKPGQSLEQTLKFLELIPFAETRNYVQRVLENEQIYRRLLTANAPISLEQQLLR